MTEAQAKKLLRAMLRSLTPGSILHLLSQLFGESAKRFRSRGEEAAEKQTRDAAATLFVVGLGVDAACPR
jgi:hypothetical protein